MIRGVRTTSEKEKEGGVSGCECEKEGVVHLCVGRGLITDGMGNNGDGTGCWQRF